METLDTKGLDKILPELMEKLPEGHALRKAFNTILNETDVRKAQNYYNRLAEAYGAGVDLLTLDANYLITGTTAVSNVETYGLDKVLNELVRTLPEGETKEAFITVLKETDVEKLKVYYGRLVECWGANGRIDNISPKYLLTGSIE